MSDESARGRASHALVWQAIRAVLNETDAVAGILLAIVFILPGVAMLHSPAFGGTIGVGTILVGLAGFISLSKNPNLPGSISLDPRASRGGG